MQHILKALSLALCAAVMLVTCGSADEVTQASQTWEYKVVTIPGHPTEDKPEFGNLDFGDQTRMLNRMGADGWELVSAYTEIGTAHPNFGSNAYVNGIRDNVRAIAVNFVFKRPKAE